MNERLYIPHSGTGPAKPDPETLSYRKTFGAVPIDVKSIPDFNLHFGPVPDQDLPNPIFNIPAQPNGCTNYSTCQVAANEDSILYNPGFTESLTHANERGGGNVRDSLLTSVNVGLQAQGESISDVGKHKRPQGPFRVGPNPDYFTGIMTALWISKRSISTGTPYYRSWATVDKSGLVTTDFTEDTNTLGWHNWVLCGKKTINGEAYVIAETHQGEQYADGGFSYYSQQDINRILQTPGCCTFTVPAQSNATPQSEAHLFLHNLGFGMIGPDVKELQHALVFLGYSIPDAVTNIYGKETVAAVFKFQAANGISDDGTHFGPRTRLALNNILNPNQTWSGSVILFIRTYLGF